MGGSDQQPTEPRGGGPVGYRKHGGRLESAYYAFGDYDVVAIVEVPDNVSAAAFSLALNAGGALKAAKTTPLMTVEEGMEAMRKAGGTGYRPPSR